MPTLEDMGERKAVQALLRLFDRGHTPGLGDDCGIIPWGDQYLLLTTDVVNEKTHFPQGTTAYDMGWYSVAVNLSDIAAMGGYALAFIAAISLPRSTDFSILGEMARGMDVCTKQFGVAVYGGDTKEADSISIAGVAAGKVQKDLILLRTGCRPGDILAVTGDIGHGGWALESIRQNGPSREALDILLHPTPRLDVGIALAESGAITSCMDSSDGLASSLGQFSQANGVGFEVEEDRLPLYARAKSLAAVKPTSVALYSGGDFELVATIRPESFDTVQAVVAKRGSKLTAIGHVTKARELTLLTAKGREPIADRGWEHFRM